MKRAARDRPSAPAPPAPPALLDRVLFGVLLALLAARPLVGESLEPLESGLLAALPQTGGPTPATTAGLDFVVLAAAGLALARRGRWRRHPGAAGGVLLLTAAVAVSCAAAGDRHLARLAGSNLLILVLAGAALSALVRAPWMRTLVVGALLASGSTTAVKCVSQRYLELPDTERYWEQEEKPRLLALGIEPDDPVLVNYERRLLAREPHGFLLHPNVTASCLLLPVLILAGLLGAGLGLAARRAPSPPGPAAPAAGVLRVLLAAGGLALAGLALVLTGSLGAALAAAGGLVALLGLRLAGRWTARHGRGVLAGLVAGYAAVVGGGAAWGLLHGTLPHPSLAFRWYYWTAAARALADAPLTGLGSGNFAAAYMRYKPAASTEEVRNAHNLWVSLLVELGPLGLAAGVVLGLVCVRAALGGLDPPAAGAAGGGKVTAARAVPIAAGVLLVHALLAGTPFATPGVLIVWAVDVALTWGLALVAGLWLVGGLPASGARWLAAGLCAALLAGLVHALVDFALLTPGGLAMFVLVVVAACGMPGRASTDPEAAPESAPAAARGRVRRAVPAAVALALVAGHGLLVLRPVWVTTRGLQGVDAALRAPPSGSRAERVRAAAAALARQSAAPAAARAAARALAQLAQQPGADDEDRVRWLEESRRYAERAVALNPRDTNNHALLATGLGQLAGLHAGAGRAAAAGQAWQAAAAAWDQAVACYPTNPRTRISAGRAWFEVWRGTGAAEAAGAARAHLNAALEIDALRPPGNPVRLRAHELETVRALLAELPPDRGASGTRPQASAALAGPAGRAATRAQ